MKIGTLIVSCAALIISLFAIVSGDQQVVDSHEEVDRTITLVGQSERFVAPDIADVSFSLTRKTPNAQEALNSVNERMGVILKELLSLGILEKDVKTTNYSINPEYRYVKQTAIGAGPDNGRDFVETGNKRVFDGYRVQQNVHVVIRDLENVEKIMTQLASLEIDNLSNLNFSVDDDAGIKEELRSEAIADAKEKAGKLEKELGVKLRRIVGFSENGGSQFPYAANTFAKVASDAAALEEAVISVGENRQSAHVSVTFIIE